MVDRDELRTAFDDLWLAGWLTRAEYQQIRFLLAKGTDARLLRTALALQETAMGRMYATELAS